MSPAAKALRAWREGHAISQERLAKATSVPYKSVHEWEFGAKVPNFLNAVKLEEITDGAVHVEAWGYPPEEICLLVAFGLRRHREGTAATFMALASSRKAILFRKPVDASAEP